MVPSWPARRIFPLVLIFLFCPFLASSSTAMTQTCCSNVRVVAGVHIDEQAGTLSPAEVALLRRLSEKMLPLPDTIRVRTDSVHYGVYSPIGGTVISLSTDRFRDPDSLSRTAPYLYGRTNAAAESYKYPAPRYTHTLAHEVAHFLAPHLNATDPRPAWGIAGSIGKGRQAREVEAEIMAAVLQGIAFGTELKALGYPRSVSIPGVGSRSTQALLREYRGIIADTWRLPAAGT